MAWRDGCNVWWPGGSGVLPVSLPGQAVVGVHEVGEDGLDGTVDGLETKKQKCRRGLSSRVEAPLFWRTR